MKYNRVILLILCIVNTLNIFAVYDGRLADDPYHKSPILLYIIIIIAIVGAVVKGFASKNNKGAGTIRKKTATKSKPVSKIYQETGMFWDECPSCKGSGWVDGKEVSYLVTPPETICCDQCKGYGRQLTHEAELLHAEYCKQFDEEQTKLWNLLSQINRESAEERKKIDADRWLKKQQAISQIKSAGRSVLKEDEYLEQLDELRPKRRELAKKIMAMLETEPLCTSCQDEKPIKDCPICRGTGHILTAEANELMDVFSELVTTIKQLWSDLRALYLPDTDSSIHISDRRNFLRLSAGAKNDDPPKSTLIRNRILQLLIHEPICPHCMGAGHRRVILDFATNKAYEQVVCPRCKGHGRLYYNNR